MPATAQGKTTQLSTFTHDAGKQQQQIHNRPQKKNEAIVQKDIFQLFEKVWHNNIRFMAVVLSNKYFL